LGSRYGLEIRSATSLDAPGLAGLLGTAGLSIPASDLAERLGALRHEQGAVLIATEWGPPSGVIALHWYRTIAAAAPVAQITLLLVAPDDRRRGVGRLLLKAAAQAARLAGCDELQLLAPPDQPALQAFREATGFTQAGTSFVRPLRKKG
jgi:GNAT superfamily N-acetyltransferase